MLRRGHDVQEIHPTHKIKASKQPRDGDNSSKMIFNTLYILMLTQRQDFRHASDRVSEQLRIVCHHRLACATHSRQIMATVMIDD